MGLICSFSIFLRRKLGLLILDIIFLKYAYNTVNLSKHFLHMQILISYIFHLVWNFVKLVNFFFNHVLLDNLDQYFQPKAKKRVQVVIKNKKYLFEQEKGGEL